MAETVYSEKCVVVPEEYFVESKAEEYLKEFFETDGENNNIFHINFDHKVLVYVGTVKGSRPELYNLLEAAFRIEETNKIVASYKNGILFLVIYSGKELLLCNSYKAVDFATAEYFIFLALNRLQLNAAVSGIYFNTPLETKEKISLLSYFKRVESLCG